MSRRLSAFTLIELIVVMAIIVTLSVIGFISYNSYVRDARNATRQSQLEEAVASIDRFIFNNTYAPRCSDSAGAAQTAGTPTVCYFTPGYNTQVVAAKAQAVESGASAYLPMNGGVRVGVLAADWTKLNLKSDPTDPRGSYFLYGTDGGSKYAIFAVREEASGYSTMVRGFKAMPWDSASPTTDVIDTNLFAPAGGNTVLGWATTGGAFGTSTSALLGDGNVTTAGGTTGPVPYKW